MSVTSVYLDDRMALAAYMEAAPLWPPPRGARRAARTVSCLLDIADDYDCVVLDGFGVLNIGAKPLPAMPAIVAQLQAAQKTVLVLTNGATVPTRLRPDYYADLGYVFSADHIISSRDVAKRGLRDAPSHWRWGVSANATSMLGELAIDGVRLDREAADYANADAFLLLSSGAWDLSRQEFLEAALRRRARPVYVANPDMIAPFETYYTTEPGYFALLVYRHTGIMPQFYGKPFANAFDAVRERLEYLGRRVAPHRTLMVGDTPFTDILGGNAAGFHTALMADHGFCRGRALKPLFAQCGIRPDWVISAFAPRAP